MANKVKGPRRVTLKNQMDSRGGGVKFENTEAGVFVEVLGLERPVYFSLKDAQVRKLRNWLNWYLDEK